MAEYNKRAGADIDDILADHEARISALESAPTPEPKPEPPSLILPSYPSYSPFWNYSAPTEQNSFTTDLHYYTDCDFYIFDGNAGDVPNEIRRLRGNRPTPMMIYVLPEIRIGSDNQPVRSPTTLLHDDDMLSRFMEQHDESWYMHFYDTGERMRSDWGSFSYWHLDPGNREVQDFLCDVALSILDRFDWADGVLWDNVFGRPNVSNSEYRTKEYPNADTSKGHNDEYRNAWKDLLSYVKAITGIWQGANTPRANNTQVNDGTGTGTANFDLMSHLDVVFYENSFLNYPDSNTLEQSYKSRWQWQLEHELINDLLADDPERIILLVHQIHDTDQGEPVPSAIVDADKTVDWMKAVEFAWASHNLSVDQHRQRVRSRIASSRNGGYGRWRKFPELFNINLGNPTDTTRKIDDHGVWERHFEYGKITLNVHSEPWSTKALDPYTGFIDVE